MQLFRKRYVKSVSLMIWSFMDFMRPTQVLRILHQGKHCQPGLKGTSDEMKCKILFQGRATHAETREATTHLRLKAEQSCHPGLRLGLKGKAPGQTGLLTQSQVMKFNGIFPTGVQTWLGPMILCFSFQFYPFGMKISSWCLCPHCSLEPDAWTIPTGRTKRQ